MGIELKPNGFYEWDADTRFSRPRSVGVQSSRVSACMERYNRERFGGLFGSPHFGFTGVDLNFLRAAIVKPTWLWFWDVNLQNVDAIYELEELDQLGINPKRPGIDFSRFRRLSTVVNHWIKQDTGLGDAAIEKYHLWHFKPRSNSFIDLEIPLSVQSLELNWANPTDLNGLPALEKLTELQIHRCRNLADLSALPQIAPNLQRLLTTTSSRISARDGVLDHPNLKSARIDGKEVLGQPER